MNVMQNMEHCLKIAAERELEALDPTNTPLTRAGARKSANLYLRQALRIEKQKTAFDVSKASLPAIIPHPKLGFVPAPHVIEDKVVENKAEDGMVMVN